MRYNAPADLVRCFLLLLAQKYPHYEIIVVDNASTDETVRWLTTHYPEVRLLRNEQNIGFAAAVKQGFAAARGDVLVELTPTPQTVDF